MLTLKPCCNRFLKYLMNNSTDILFDEIKGNAGNIGLITLNRPQYLNAMTTAMCAVMYDQLEKWEKNTDIKAMVIRGAGERAFCAGGDIRHFYEMGKAGLAKSKEFFWHEYRLNHHIFHLHKPYIALLHGITMGGGVGVSIHGSHRVAAENLVFAMPETGIGFFPDIGASYFLPRFLDRTGFYLALTGAKLNPADAHYIGAIDFVVPQQRFDELITKIAETKFSTDVHAAVTDIINPFKLNINSPTLLAHRVDIDHCFSHDTVEKIIAALREEKIPWTQQVADTIETKSPTSLKVTLQELQRGSLMEFDDCMRMEFRLANHFLENHDFLEGIRAAVIDKDRNPKWQPATLAEVNEKDVEKYFASVSSELNFD